MLSPLLSQVPSILAYSLRAVSRYLMQRKSCFLQLLKSLQVAGKPPISRSTAANHRLRDPAIHPLFQLPSLQTLKLNKRGRRGAFHPWFFKLSSSQKSRSDWIADSRKQRGNQFFHLLHHIFPILAATDVQLCSGWSRLPRQGSARRSGGYKGEPNLKGLESPLAPKQDGSGEQCTKIGCKEMSQMLTN